MLNTLMDILFILHLDRRVWIKGDINIIDINSNVES